MKKCNYVDTMFGMFATNYLINQIDKSKTAYDLLKVPRWTLRIVEMSTILFDVAEIVESIDTWFFHFDNHDLGIILGKGFKISY